MRKLPLFSTIGILLLAGCTEGAAPERLMFSKDAGDNQVGTAGQPVAVSPRVRLTGDGGAGIAGVTVVFAVASGGGSVSGPTQTTDADGRASVTGWSLGSAAGENSLTATVQGRDVDGGSVTFTASAGAGPAAILEKQAGDGQTGQVAMPLTTSPVARVTDQFGNPVANTRVDYAVMSGGGTTTGASPMTGPNGIASVGQWILGNTTGQNTLAASVPGMTLTGSPALFSATATAGPPAAVAVVAGDNQSAPVNSLVAVAPRVRATDAFGNNVSGVAFDFAVTQGGGAATGTSQTSAADGSAAVGSWTLGALPGVNQLTASAAGTGIAGNPIVFNATATALFNAARYAGTWTGNWINNTFQSVGTNTLTIAVDETAMTVTIAFSTTGSALGVPGGVPEQSNMTAWDDTGFTATVALNVYGTATLTVDADGNITMSGVNIPQSGFARWDGTGTITDTQIILDWTVTFSAGGTATGRTTLNRQ